MKSRWMKFNAVGLMVVVSYFGSAWYFQYDMMYPQPQAGDRNGLPESLGGEIIWTGENNQVENWYFPPPPSDRPSAALIYTHGNGDLIDRWAEKIQPLRAAGMGILLAEYPGYGRSAGQPSQESIAASLSAAYDKLVSKPEIDADRIVVHGQSIGGGVAGTLIAGRPLAAAVLQSTFSSFRRYAQRYAIPLFLVRDPYETDQALQKFSGPVLILHGDADEIFDPDHAERLHAAADNSEIVIQSCGHNDCPLPWGRIESFLRRNHILN